MEQKKENQVAVPVEMPSPLQVIMGEDAVVGATRIANKLSAIVESRNLFTDISGKKHIHVEGWTTLGALLGVVPDVISSVRVPGVKVKGYLIDNGREGRFVKAAFYNKKTMKVIPDAEGNDLREIEEVKYESEIQIRSMDGKYILGRAKSICSNLEDGKLTKPEYSIESQSQTRATGKAFRLQFSWIITLAGFEPGEPDDEQGGPKKREAEVIDPKASKVKAEPKTDKAQVAATEPDTRPLTEQWTELVKEAQKLGIKIADILAEVCTEKNGKGNWIINPSHLEKLVPMLAEKIEQASAGTVTE